jgi:hypothetical protein
LMPVGVSKFEEAVAHYYGKAVNDGVGVVAIGVGVQVCGYGFERMVGLNVGVH